MSEAPENNPFIAIAGTMGRMEAMLNALVAGFSEFKVSHREDLLQVYTDIKDVEARLKVLEEEASHRKGGWFSTRTLIEVIIGGFTLYLYFHMSNLSK